MTKDNLSITVSGTCASGKSRMTFLLKNMLRGYGFEVNQEFNEDHPTEENFDKTMSMNFEDVMENFIKDKTITIKEQQVQRAPIHG